MTPDAIRTTLQQLGAHNVNDAFALFDRPDHDQVTAKDLRDFAAARSYLFAGGFGPNASPQAMADAYADFAQAQHRTKYGRDLDFSDPNVSIDEAISRFVEGLR